MASAQVSFSQHFLQLSPCFCSVHCAEAFVCDHTLSDRVGLSICTNSANEKRFPMKANSKLKKDYRDRIEIRNLDSLRLMLAHIYTYGFYSKPEMLEVELISSGSQYNKLIKRLKELYFFTDVEESGTESALAVRRDRKEKRYSIRRDHFRGQTELLSAVYGIHYIMPREARLAVTLLSYYLTDDMCPPSMLATFIENILKDYETDNQNDSSDGAEYAINRCRSELGDAGYLKKGEPRKANGLLNQYSDEEISELYQLASFFAGSGYPRVPAVFLKQALLRTLRFRGLPKPPELFLFRDCPSGNVLDEDLVLQLLECSKDNEMVTFILNDKERKASPVGLMPDTKLGRWYLQAIMDGKACNIRLTNIRNLKKHQILLPNQKNNGQSGRKQKQKSPKTETEKYDREKAAALVEEASKNSYLCFADETAPVHLEAILHFPTSYLREQFERELLLGEIIQRDGQELYSVKVNNLSEIRPLIRSYLRYLELPTDSVLRQELTREYERMWKNYGAVPQIL